MFIAPDSTLKVLQDIPINNTYKNTIYFANKSDQQAYFSNMSKYTYINYSYLKEQKKIRVGTKADNLYNCNYLMYQNTAYGSKWFYAFITKVEFINNTCSEISFEIDVMQTWLVDDDYFMKPSFVEREHSYTDNAGDNIVTETLDLGNIVCSNIVGTGKFDNYVAVIATAWLPTTATGGYVTGLFSGLSYIAGEIDTPEGVQALLDLLTTMTEAKKVDSIVSIFVMPTAFYTSNSAPTVEVTAIAKPTQIDGYTPRNKKLLTYPFSFLGVDCGDNSAIYRYEYFTDATCQFSMNGCVAPNPEIQLVPVDYNGTDFNYIEKLVMSGFPQVGYAIDSFKAWLAQSASGQFISLVSAGGIAGAGIASGNVPLAVGGAVGLASSINNIVQSSTKPPQAKGSNGSSITVATRTKDFWFKRMHITSQYAKIIDDYFDVFGYATNRVKVPNIASRPHWNYVKTTDIGLVGSVPADDMAKLQSIYNSGVTFWKHGNEVGDYSLSNSI